MSEPNEKRPFGGTVYWEELKKRKEQCKDAFEFYGIEWKKKIATFERTDIYIGVTKCKGRDYICLIKVGKGGFGLGMLYMQTDMWLKFIEELPEAIMMHRSIHEETQREIKERLAVESRKRETLL